MEREARRKAVARRIRRRSGRDWGVPMAGEGSESSGWIAERRMRRKKAETLRRKTCDLSALMIKSKFSWESYGL